MALSYGKLSDDQLSCQVQGEKATLVWDHVEAPENLRVFDHEDKGMVFRQEVREGRPVEVAPCPANDMACEIATSWTPSWARGAPRRWWPASARSRSTPPTSWTRPVASSASPSRPT